MKSTIYLILLIGLNNLYSQNIDLTQLALWRETNYKIVETQLLKLNWEKSVSNEPTDNYRNDQYSLNKGSKNEKGLALMYTDDYKIENNTLRYESSKNGDYDNFVNQIKSSGYKLIKTKKNERVVSDYYRSDKITVIISILKGIDEQMQEIEFFSVHLSTNEDYFRSHKD